MAKIGAAHPCWAKINTETSSALPTYDAGLVLGKLVKAEVAVKFAIGELYADNVLEENPSEFASGTITMTSSNITLVQQAAMTGATLDGNELGDGAEDTAPYGGLGYYQTLLVNGVKSYRATFYPKVKARIADELAETKGASFTLGTDSVEFTVCNPSYGKWRYREEFSTQAAAIAYLENKLNIGTYYEVDVQVNGATGTDGADVIGTIYVASGENLEITITGSPTALYDNGTENSASISGGTYTLSSVTAAHQIAIVF